MVKSRRLYTPVQDANASHPMATFLRNSDV